jgi:hypothetical protein
MMITPGDLFIQRDAARPRMFQIQDDAHRTGWSPVRHNLTSRELDTELSKLGWTFFYMANVIRKTALAVDRKKGAAVALKRVMASVREEGCNSLQVEDVERHSFLGIPYISVSAHPRHVQKSGVFSPHLQTEGAETAMVDRVAKTVV